jgi:sulfonate transport system substrate-binding protein
MRTFIAIGLAVGLLAGCVSGESDSDAGSDSAKVRLDYAYYNPASLVLREQKWLENEGVPVEWLLSAGSNKANENLRAGALDIGSTAGAAALVARANGTPIKTVAVFSQPEWAALVVRKDSPVTSVAQLKGRKIAATKGTDPYFFLLQALDKASLKPTDVSVVNLQHADGKAALERGDVDAWAGLDPHMAQTEVDSGSRLLFRDVSFNSYGVLNAREAFLTEHPDVAQKVVDAYERARTWIAEHPEEAVALLARESKVSPQVATVVLTTRTRFDVDPVPGVAQRAVLERILPVLVADGNVKSQDAATQALDTLFEPAYATARSAP